MTIDPLSRSYDNIYIHVRDIANIEAITLYDNVDRRDLFVYQGHSYRDDDEFYPPRSASCLFRFCLE